MSIDSTSLNKTGMNATIEQVVGGTVKNTGSSQKESVPEVIASSTDVGDSSGIPVLTPPKNGLSLDTLLSAIGYETRRQACQEGVTSLEVKAEEQAKINDQELEELMEQLEKMKSKDVADGFLKAFQIIGAIFGAVASVASIAAGIVTGNPLLVVGGAIAMGMVIDSTLGLATDGKICISSGIQKACEACGMSEEAAKWVGVGVTMALNLLCIVCNIGGAAKAAGIAADTASKIMKTLSMTATISNFGSAASNIGSGASTIASSVYGYQIAQSQAEVKDLEAILERIKAAIDMEKALVEAEMERSNDLLGAVKEIVDQVNDTQCAIMTNVPSMA